MSQALTTGVVYWLAIAVQGGTPSLRATTGAMFPLGKSTAGDAVQLAQDTHLHETLAGAWTTLPSTAGTLTYASTVHPLFAIGT